MNFKFLKQFTFIFVFLFLLEAVYPLGATASDEDETEKIIEEILSCNLSQSDNDTLDEWINGYLPNDIGVCAEWYVLGLSQRGKYDFSEYEKTLSDYLENKKISSASTRLKFALSLVACGSDSEYVENALNSSMGKQGIMSYIYGLHLLNNGYNHLEFTVSSTVDILVDMQLSDGGWALSGEISDVDVTAMTLQAMSPYYNEDKVKKSVDLALDFLSKNQLSEGDYISYGVQNPESSAQVITALSSLGIDFMTDSRFVKNGNTLLDGILKYRLSDGSYSHNQSGESNKNSTVQVFYSMISYQRLKEGKSGLYILDSVNSTENNGEESIEQSESIASEESTDESSIIEETQNFTSEKIKIVLISAETCVFVFFVILMFFRKKLNLKNFLFLFCVFLIILTLTLTAKIQSKEEYYNEQNVSKENVCGAVTISIKCDTLIGKADNSYIPKDGIILNETEISISKGDTVYSILMEAAKKHSLIIENDGNDKMAYISGINHIYEFDYGDLSGWMFFVNGKESSVGCTSYVLSDGDVVEWIYSCDMGRDIE